MPTCDIFGENIKPNLPVKNTQKYNKRTALQWSLLLKGFLKLREFTAELENTTMLWQSVN